MAQLFLSSTSGNAHIISKFYNLTIKEIDTVTRNFQPPKRNMHEKNILGAATALSTSLLAGSMASLGIPKIWFSKV